jgi:hypothetical protein
VESLCLEATTTLLFSPPLFDPTICFEDDDDIEYLEYFDPYEAIVLLKTTRTFLFLQSLINRAHSSQSKLLTIRTSNTLSQGFLLLHPKPLNDISLSNTSCCDTRAEYPAIRICEPIVLPRDPTLWRDPYPFLRLSFIDPPLVQNTEIIIRTSPQPSSSSHTAAPPTSRRNHKLVLNRKTQLLAANKFL